MGDAPFLLDCGTTEEEEVYEDADGSSSSC